MDNSPNEGQEMRKGPNNQTPFDLIAHALAAGYGIEGLDKHHLQRIKQNPIRETLDTVFFELERHKPIKLVGYPLLREGQEGFVACRISMRQYSLNKASYKIKLECVWGERIEVDYGYIASQEGASLTDAGIVDDIVQDIPREQHHDQAAVEAAVRRALRTLSFGHLTEGSDLPCEVWDTFKQQLEGALFETLFEKVQEQLDEDL